LLNRNLLILPQSTFCLGKPLHLFLINIYENHEIMQSLFWTFWSAHNPCFLCYVVRTQSGLISFVIQIQSLVYLCFCFFFKIYPL
jgi:hypothetical protein